MVQRYTLLSLSIVLALATLAASLALAQGDPTASDENRAQQRAATREAVQRQYRPFFEESGLGSDQQEQLVEVLTAERTQGAYPDSSAVVARMRGDTSTSAGTLASVEAIVGKENLRSFEEYEKHIREHMRVSEIRSALAASGNPLSKQQRASLTQVFVKERSRVESPSSGKKVSSFDDLVKRMSWRDEYDLRVQQGAASILSPKQMEALTDNMSARGTQRRLAIEAQRNQPSASGLFWYPPE